MEKDYIKITILNIKELNIDDSSKADLCCYIYCTSWGEKSQQTKVFNNTIVANFSADFQIPIISFETDTITFKIKDISKNRILSSATIQVSRIPPGDGFKVINLIPESYVKNGGKLEIEFQGKDEEYSDSTEPLIPPPLPLSEDSDPSFDDLEKLAKINHHEPSLLSFQPESNPKIAKDYSNYSYYDYNSNDRNEKENLHHSSSNSKQFSLDQQNNHKNQDNTNEYSYYSTESSNNHQVNQKTKDMLSDYDYNSTKKTIQKKNRRSSSHSTVNQQLKADKQNQIANEYSYYSDYSDQPKKQANANLNDYEYYSTDSPDPPKHDNTNSTPKIPKNMNLSSSDQFCDSYNYESSTDSPIQLTKVPNSSSASQIDHNKVKSSHSNSNRNSNSNQDVEVQNNNVNVLSNNDNDNEPKSKNINCKQKEIAKENKNPNNKESKKESKKAKPVAVVERKKAAATTTATKKMRKRVDAATFIKYFKVKTNSQH